MGGNRLMFPHPWETLEGVILHDWPPYKGEKSVAEMARAVCDHFDVADGDVLVGASLGGMVACEAAKLRRLRALFLVGSAVCKEEISALLATLHPLAQYAPIDLLRMSSTMAPLERFRASLSSVPSDLVRMLQASDTRFIRAMCPAIFEWEGLGPTRTPCYRLHGRGDCVIPPPTAADLLVDGGHLISMTNASECVEFIRVKIRTR
jgi:pimeloyl-ACP methyl ester carboxylesterase